MQIVHFHARGHENVTGSHKTTLELTTEDFLTPTGTCIIGVNASQTLNGLDPEIKELVRSPTTVIQLIMRIENISEEIKGEGSPGLTYADVTSMVVRKSNFECDRTLMINADKAACDLDRAFVKLLQIADTVIECELRFFT